MNKNQKQIVFGVSTILACISMILGIAIGSNAIEEEGEYSNLETFELQMPTKTDVEAFIDDYIEDEIIEDQEEESIWNNL